MVTFITEQGTPMFLLFLHFNLKFWLCFTMYRKKHYKRTDFQK